MLNKNLTLLYSLLLVLSISSFQICFSQTPDTLWTKMLGGNEDEYGFYSEQTSDGGYIITGTTESFGVGYDDVWLVKTNSSGDTLWTKTYGGSNYDEGDCVHQTNDGGYIVFAETGSFNPNFYRVWLIKTDADGDTIWTKLFGNNQNYYIESGLELPGIGYIFLGFTKVDAADPEDILLVKINLSGEINWTKTYGGTDRDLPSSIYQTGDGGFIISGSTKSLSAGDFDAWLIRADSDGNLIWTKKYGGTGYDLGWDARQTDDDGFIVAGLTASFGHMNNYVDAWLIKTDYNGDTLWTKTFGGLDHDGALSVLQTSDAGYIFTGYYSLEGYESDVWVVKTDEDGNIQWSKNYGGIFFDMGRLINPTSDGGYIISGEYYSVTANSRDIWLLKIGPDPNDVEKDEKAPIPETIVLKQNYPNPFNPSTTIEFGIPESQFITLAVYNLLGEQVGLLVNENLSAGNYKATWDADDLPSGIYIYKLIARGFSQSNKMILLK